MSLVCASAKTSKIEKGRALPRMIRLLGLLLTTLLPAHFLILLQMPV